MRTKGWLTLVLVAALVGGGAWYWHAKGGAPTQAPEAPYTLPELTKPYSNSDYRFSFMLPTDFTAQEMPQDENGARTFLFQNDRGEGIQIVITPFDEDIATLTKERIQQDIPDLKITDEQPVEIGQNHTGLAFKSDNEAFGGASREVWFVFRGNLYQISTYERLDSLLQAIFGTWQFQ
jgi:hypothetical protein